MIHYKTARKAKNGLPTPAYIITNDPDIRMLVWSPKLWSLGPVVLPSKNFFSPATTSIGLRNRSLLLPVLSTGSLVYKPRCCFSYFFIVRVITIIIASFALTFVSAPRPCDVLVIVYVVESALFWI